MWILMCFTTAILCFTTEGAEDDDCNLSNRAMVKTITTHTGQSVLLPCSCDKPITKSFTFKWNVPTNGHVQIFPRTEGKPYDDRIQRAYVGSPGNFTLLLSKVNEADNKVYRCFVDKQYTDIRLSVKGCILSGPNNWVKEITGTSGQSVVLPCSCEELQAKPANVYWKFFKRSPVTSHVTVTYTDRVKLIGTDTFPGNLSLQLSHLTKEDEGDYRCMLSNTEYTDIRLSIKVQNGESTMMEAQPEDGQMVLTFIYTTAAFMSLLIIGAVALCTCRRKKEKVNERGKTSTKEDDLPSAVYEVVYENNMIAQPETQNENSSVTYSTIVHIERNEQKQPTGHMGTNNEKSVYAMINTAH